MKFLQKYLLLLFLLANTTAEYLLFMSISKYLFYAVLGISVPFLFSHKVFSFAAMRKCPHIYVLAGILIVYQLLFGLNSTGETIAYFIGKLATFGIMMLCISTNFEFYLRKSIVPFSYVILGLIILGWFYHRTGSVDEYLVFGFANRNAACTLASIGFAGFLFAKDQYKWFDYVNMSILFLTILIGGSRNSLAMCIIFIMIKYGLSLRLIITMAFLSVIIIFVLPRLGIEIKALDRLIDTLTGKLATDRADQRIGAMMMIQEHPWIGWGLASQLQGRALEISYYGAHNGYLTFLMYMGYPMGIAFISTIVGGVIKRLRLYKFRDGIVNYHLAVMVAILFAANQEDYLVGVNQITTNMFFVSFVVTGIYYYFYYKKSHYIGFSKNIES